MTTLADAADRPAPPLHPQPRAHPARGASASPKLGRPVSQPLAVRVVMVLAFGAVLTGAVVNWSLRHGRLILNPDYDDVGYMEDGMRRMRILHDYGVIDVVADYLNRPPHSPYSGLLATAAFTLLGGYDWAPYVANIVLVCGYFALAGRLLRGVPLWQKVLVFLFVMSVPLVVRSAAEFRPDHASALLLTGGLILLMEGRFVTATRRHLAGAGALCGLAVFAKPPMFIAAGLLLGWALLLATAVDYFGERRRLSRHQVIRAWLTCLVPFVLIPLPHFLVAGPMVVAYIYDNMFGQFKDIWVTKGTIGWHLNYYLFGAGGQTMLGRRTSPTTESIPTHLYLILIVLAAGLVHVLLRRRRREIARAAGLAALLLAVYLIPSVTQNKTQFFGLSFHTFLVFLAVLTLRHLLLAERLRRAPAAVATALAPARAGVRRVAARWASAGLVTLTALGLIVFSWPTRVGDRSADWIRNRRDIVNGIFAAVVNNPNHPTPRVFVACVGDVNKQVLNYMAMRELAPVGFYDVNHSGDLQTSLHEFDRADMVIVAETGSGLIADFLPSYRIQDALLADLRSRTDYREAGQFIFEPAGKGFYLFERVGAFGGWSDATGLGELEGPTRVTGNRVVRWGWGPATTLTIDVPTDGEYKFFYSGSGWGGQEMTVKLDGKDLVTRTPMPHREYGHFTQAAIPMRLSAGRHEIRLEYRIWDTTTPRPMGVLFDRLSVHRVK